MTQKSWPWDTNPPTGGPGDGSAGLNEATSREFLALYFGVQDPTVEGVVKGLTLGELAVGGSASPLEVDAGAAICYGLYISDVKENLTVVTPSLGITGGRVVLQTYWAGTGGALLEARTRLAVKLNADGVAAIPALTQTPGTTWEISLATFTITTGGVITVTDDRTFRVATAMSSKNEFLDVFSEFVARRGGSATDWNTGGTTIYTPDNDVVRVSLVTTITVTGGVGNFAAALAGVTFDGKPLCTGWAIEKGSSGLDTARLHFLITSITTSAIQGYVRADGGVSTWDGDYRLHITLEGPRA
ncbi:MAG: hypothetical protein H6636_06985 [Anaerolineales bacterium]|nr:hypothetical protein [Anaerolineales bacterium]